MQFKTCDKLTNGITPISYDCGTWIRPIDELGWYFNTIWSDRSVFYVKPVLPNDAGIGRIVVVVRREIVTIAPTRSIRSAVYACCGS